jgi:hypothetical protein
MSNCPVCNSQLSREVPRDFARDIERFACPRCGEFSLSRTLVADLPGTLRKEPDAAMQLSHALRRAQETNPWVLFTTKTLDEILRRPLPRPTEQADLLVRWLAKNADGPGELVSISAATHAGIVGAKSAAGFGLIVDHLFSIGLIKGHHSQTIGSQGAAQATLSFAGWEYFESLDQGTKSYRKAFMAMKFGDLTLNTILETAFKPAAHEAGFELFNLEDVPKAGLIDDRMRVEIQSSDFLIADLTHENAGAYWEAGYAEGLGKPVIYTCEQRKFETAKTHFDTNHHLTVLWDASAPHVAGVKLKSTIRATLPHLAKQTDSG